MNYRRLIACDLDGTLLNRDSRIPDNLAEDLRKTLPPDTAFTLATGRVLHELSSFVRQLDCIHVPVIAETGAALLDPRTGAEIRTWDMPGAVVRGVLTTLEESQWEYNVYLSAGDRCVPFCSHTGVWFDDIPGTEVLRPLLREIRNWHATDLKGIRKIFLRCDPQQTQEIIKALLEVAHGSADIQRSDTNCIDILATGVNKGVALLGLMKSLEIPPAFVMAIGDSETDLAMFDTAGVSVAVDNAESDIKHVARFVVPSNDQNGVLVAVRRFVRGEYDD